MKKAEQLGKSMEHVQKHSEFFKTHLCHVSSKTQKAVTRIHPRHHREDIMAADEVTGKQASRKTTTNMPNGVERRPPRKEHRKVAGVAARRDKTEWISRAKQGRQNASLTRRQDTSLQFVERRNDQQDIFSQQRTSCRLKSLPIQTLRS